LFLFVIGYVTDCLFCWLFHDKLHFCTICTGCFIMCSIFDICAWQKYDCRIIFWCLKMWFVIFLPPFSCNQCLMYQFSFLCICWSCSIILANNAVSIFLLDRLVGIASADPVIISWASWWFEADVDHMY
jgi:hypothetical protein